MKMEHREPHSDRVVTKNVGGVHNQNTVCPSSGYRPPLGTFIEEKNVWSRIYKQSY